MTEYKNYPVQVKAVPGDIGGGSEGTPGEFDAIVSVFGNVDYDNDIAMPGAFVKGLERWKSSPNNLPILWNHDDQDPMSNIGQVTEAEELGANDPRIPEWADPHVKAHGGLWIRGQLDAGPEAGAVARQVNVLLKNRRITEFSYAYNVPPGGAKKNADGVRELHQIELLEVSPVPRGANALTQLVGAKGGAPPGEPGTGNEPEGATERSPLLHIRTQCAELSVALLQLEIGKP